MDENIGNLLHHHRRLFLSRICHQGKHDNPHARMHIFEETSTIPWINYLYATTKFNINVASSLTFSI